MSAPSTDQVTDDARDRRLAESGRVGQFGTRNLVVVQANGLKNIKSIDVANDGWTSWRTFEK